MRLQGKTINYAMHARMLTQDILNKFHQLGIIMVLLFSKIVILSFVSSVKLHKTKHLKYQLIHKTPLKYTIHTGARKIKFYRENESYHKMHKQLRRLRVLTIYKHSLQP